MQLLDILVPVCPAYDIINTTSTKFLLETHTSELEGEKINTPPTHSYSALNKYSFVLGNITALLSGHREDMP